MRCSVIGLIYAGHDPKLNANRIVLILELSMFLDFVSLKYFFFIYIYTFYIRSKTFQLNKPQKRVDLAVLCSVIPLS